MLLFLLLSLVQQMPPEQAHEQSLPEQLYYADPFVRGNGACDNRLNRDQQRLFDHKFKRRIEALKLAALRRDGPSADFDVIPLLRCVADRDRVHSRFARALRDYDAELMAFEKRYAQSQ